MKIGKIIAGLTLIGAGIIGGNIYYNYKNNEYQKQQNFLEQKVEELSMDQLIERDPQFPDYLYMDNVKKIFQADVNKDKKKDLVIFHSNSDYRKIDVLAKTKEGYSLIYQATYKEGEYPILVEPQVIDLDNDGAVEVIIDKFGGGNRGGGTVQVLKCNQDKCNLGNKLYHSAGYDIEDIDNDNIKEILLGDIAGGQEELFGYQLKRWYTIAKWDGSKYKKIIGKRRLNDGTIVSSQNINPYNIPQKERTAELQRNPDPNLEDQVYNEIYQDYYEEPKRLVERNFRLNLVLRDEMATTKIHYIPNAQVHFTITPDIRDSFGTIEDYIRTNRKGVARFPYLKLAMPEDETATVCIDVETRNYLFEKDCFELSDLDNVRSGNYLGLFYVWKGKQEHSPPIMDLGTVGRYDDVTLGLDMRQTLDHRDQRRRQGYPLDY